MRVIHVVIWSQESALVSKAVRLASRGVAPHGWHVILHGHPLTMERILRHVPGGKPTADEPSSMEEKNSHDTATK